MRRLAAGLLTVGLVAAILFTPRPVLAHHAGRFFGGFAVGTATGLILGSTFAPPAVVYGPPPVYVAPPPVYYYYPAPAYAAPSPVWVPSQWVWNGYGWVRQPGYWRY